MLKWKLMISTLPVVLGLLGLKLRGGRSAAGAVRRAGQHLHAALIKDVDNPFDFKEGTRDHSSGEVTLFPLDEYRARLAARAGK